MPYPSSIKLLALSSLFFAFTTAQIDPNDPSQNQGSIGDLATLGPVGPNPSAFVIDLWTKGIGSAETDDIAPKPDAATCAQDPCCPWWSVAKDLTDMFVDKQTKQCNDDAAAAVRLGFHDAASFSRKLAAQGQTNGGADGSLLLFREDSRPENNGLQVIVSKLIALKDRYKVGAADLIQFAAQHATVSCPMGPRISFFAGRIDATQPAPPGLLPDIHQPADQLLTLFLDKTISAPELAALLGAHTSAKQFHVDTSIAGRPIDSTPGIWDTNFYGEVLQNQTSNNVFRFQSDKVLSENDFVKSTWQSFVGQQNLWNTNYANSYTRLSLLGVNNINNLTDCSKTLPARTTSFPGALPATRRRRSYNPHGYHGHHASPHH